MTPEEQKVLEVSLKLDRVVLDNCPCRSHGDHNEPSGIFFRFLLVPLEYFKPCKKHLDLYLKSQSRGTIWEVEEI